MTYYMKIHYINKLTWASVRSIAVAGCLAVATGAHAILPEAIEFADAGRDTVFIDQVLAEVSALRPASPGEAVRLCGERFLGHGYVARSLEGDEETLRVRTDSVDCTIFAELAMALGYSVRHGRDSWRDVVNVLEGIRYRGGVLNGYASRLHYNADWMADNVAKGYVRDVARGMDDARFVVKTIDYMSRHRDSYAQLKDSVVFEEIKNVEEGFRNHRFPYIRTRELGKRAVTEQLRDGDILSFTSNWPDLDVTHMGILVMHDGVPYVMHASMGAGRVVVSEVPLAAFVARNHGWTGVRIARLQD